MGDLHRRLIAFDLDGTVVDSRRDLADSANQLVQELGGVPLSEETIGLMVGDGAAVLVKRVLQAANLGDNTGALARFLEIYDGRLLNYTRPYEGIADALRSASRVARVAMLTNKPLHATEQILVGLSLGEFFDEVIGGDGPYPRKPDPASLRALMASAGADSGRTLLVGDSAIDHETARRAPSRCCLADYGFGSVSVRAEWRTGEEWSVKHASELPAVFEAFKAGK